jgi:diguanylate cyclase (GGDEF)-like protein
MYCVECATEATMRLTSKRPVPGVRPVVASGITRTWTAVVVAASLLGVFELDRHTGSAPVQHLYYLPIILASLRIGRVAGIIAAGGSIALYHFANLAIVTNGYREADVIQVVLFVTVAIVTTRLADDARRLHALAMTDDLTGLHNLRSFESRLNAIVHEARRSQMPIAMLVLDVDRLKAINDTYGHLAGAEAVRLVGHTLAATLPSDAVACRYGGDEFAIAIQSCGAMRAEAIAEDLREAVHILSPTLAGTAMPPGTLSISVGIANRAAQPELSLATRAATDTDVGERLFRAADRALYAAKHQGRNRVSAG